MRTVEELRRFVEREIVRGGATVAADEELIDSGILDSAGIAHLLAFLEERYTIAVSDADLVLENFESIYSINDFIVAKRELQKT